MSAAKKPADAATQEELIFLPLGGAGEIGMNLNLYGVGPDDNRQWIMVDLGVTFGDESTPGIDLIMADPQFILDRTDQLLGLILTHGHEDHIGAVPYLWPELDCPIYATPFTASLVQRKFEEVGIFDAPLNIIPLGGQFSLGPFDLELISLTHSIPEPNAVAIRTGAGTVLHSGDWKIDDEPLIGQLTDEEALVGLGDEGVLAIICDSTNALTDGISGSEGDVRRNLEDLVSTLEGRVVVTAFASNVARVATAAHVAQVTDRHLVLVGRSMHRIVAAARENGYLDDFPTIVDERDAGYLPPEKVLYLCTGSQGEPRAALSRIASGAHPHISLEKGDAVIFSSRMIPGNEKSIFALQNDLAALGVTIHTEKGNDIHVSGHPCRDELTRMYQWVRPQISIPVHGEFRHLLAHGELAKDLQVPHVFSAPNGTMVRLGPGDPQIIDHVPAGRLHLDGEVLMPADDEVLKERKRIGFSGMISVVLVTDGKGHFAAEPAIEIMGVPFDPDEPLEAELAEVIDQVFQRDRFQKFHKGQSMEELVRRAVRQKAREITGKKPITVVRIVEIEK